MGRQEWEAVTLRHAPLGGDMENEGITWAWRTPWGVNGLNPILNTAAMWSDTGKMRLEASRTNRKAVRSLDW